MSKLFQPHVTVAAVIEQDGRFLVVQEQTPDGLRLNQPAGHLEADESLIEACVRETLEETTYDFSPTGLLGTYLWRSPLGQTFLRFAFVGQLGTAHPDRQLDHGIERTLWRSAEALDAQAHTHRSPLVMQCIRDYRAGQRFSLNAVHTHASAVLAELCR
ncbi:MAG TPA: NUDIX hydrolase [Burkholderiaceae bacterium]|nr:NUDIX hydrolase [Burkholderiaceae bacterium]